MAVKIIEGTMNVVEAARQRVQNAFDSGMDIVLSMSGGKDSICMASIVYDLIMEGAIKASQLTVQFIDEEAIFDDVVEAVKIWRNKFMLAGVKFEWFCIQIRHYNCLDSLEHNNNFITWDRYEKDKWVRPMPEFAIKSHPALKERKESYQDFLTRINKGKIKLIGIRTAESSNRYQNMATIFGNVKNKGSVGPNLQLYPIYDWGNNDVWLYIKNKNLYFPNTYLDLWRIGLSKGELRLSQMFGLDTAKSLVKIEEHQPGLMAKVIKREPNAYLASLYWDTEMFGGTKKTSKKLKGQSMDYRAEVLRLLQDIDKNFDSEMRRECARNIKKDLIRFSALLNDRGWKDAHRILMTGDYFGRHKRLFHMGLLSANKKLGMEYKKSREGKK